jgi:hypothetical protein
VGAWPPSPGTVGAALPPPALRLPGLLTFALARGEGLSTTGGEKAANLGLEGAPSPGALSFGRAGRMGVCGGLSSGEAALGGGGLSGVALGLALGLAGLGLERGGVAGTRGRATREGAWGGELGGRRDLAVDCVSGLSRAGEAEVEGLGGEWRPSPATTTLDRTSSPLAGPAEGQGKEGVSREKGGRRRRGPGTSGGSIRAGEKGGVGLARLVSCQMKFNEHEIVLHVMICKRLQINCTT